MPSDSSSIRGIRQPSIRLGARWQITVGHHDRKSETQTMTGKTVLDTCVLIFIPRKACSLLSAFIPLPVIGFCCKSGRCRQETSESFVVDELCCVKSSLMLRYIMHFSGVFIKASLICTGCPNVKSAKLILSLQVCSTCFRCIENRNKESSCSVRQNIFRKAEVWNLAILKVQQLRLHLNETHQSLAKR